MSRLIVEIIISNIDIYRVLIYIEYRYRKSYTYRTKSFIYLERSSMARKQLQNLSEPMFYVLLSLTKPLHGYGIMQKIDTITDGRVKVGAGTLYSLLARFEKEEIIVKVSNEDGKKNYQLTSKGLEVLQKEIKRLKQLVDDSKLLL